MVWPAIIAGVASIAGSLIASKASGSSPKNKQLGTQTAEQKEISKMILDSIKTGEGPLKDLFKGFDMKQFEEGVSKPALQNFQENILPMLQEKFISGGQAGSPGAARELGKAGTGLQQTLANLLYQAQTQGQQSKNQNILQALGIAKGGSGVENVHQQGTAGFGPAIFQAGSQITGSLLNNYLNKPSQPTQQANPVMPGSGYQASAYQPLAGA